MSKQPCIHGELCKAYLTRYHIIYSCYCPNCKFYEPKKVMEVGRDKMGRFKTG